VLMLTGQPAGILSGWQIPCWSARRPIEMQLNRLQRGDVPSGTHNSPAGL
jgi:hypothetical protein